MIVRVIDVYVKEQCVEEFKGAMIKNRQGSIQEPGVLRFDVLQAESDSDHFILYEVYRDEQATKDHKETAHYQEWRETVEPMMAGKRESIACMPIAPTDPTEW
jgi:autoinducer 2-degrading protein